MNKLFVTLAVIIVITNKLESQNCNYYFLQNNKTVEQTVKNKKGKVVGKQVYKVSNAVVNGKTATATLNSEFFDDKGRSLSKGSSIVKCNNGTYSIDMKMLIPPSQQQQMGAAATATSSAYLDFPATLKEGDMLKDGEFNMDYTTEAGMKGSVSISITNRKVGGKETVTSPAGNWDCYKITNDTKITVKIMGIGVPVKATVTEWFAPGFGVVKSDSNGSIMEISAIK